MKLTKEQLELIKNSDKELDINVIDGEIKITEIDKKWKPKEGELFYIYIPQIGGVALKGWGDDILYDIRNCYKTEKEAREYGKWYEIRKQLIGLAEKLGKPTREDWENLNVKKYCIKYDFDTNKIYCYSGNGIYDYNIYCLSKDFFKRAEKEIGIGDIKYFYKNGWKYNQ